MKKRYLLLVFALIVAMVGADPAGAQQNDNSRKAEARGGFKMTVHTHSNDDPDYEGLLFETDRLSFDFTEGEDFSYSSRTCGGPAAFNDLGLNFTPDYPGVDDDADGTAPVRHRVQGTIAQVNGDRGTIQGTITTVLCETVDGQQVETENVIVTHYQARYRRVSDNEVQVTGHFRISPTESTGTFAGLEGHGSIKGVLTCLGHTRRGEPSCAERGHFTDFVGARGDLSKGPGEITPGLIGGYRDPTVQTG